MKKKRDVIATWSGGKDSCFAAYKAIREGFHITYLANTISKKYKRVGFHGIEASLIHTQAEAVGIPLLQGETIGQTYTQDFKDNLQEGLSKDITGIVFGDIHLNECFNWSNTICRDLGIHAIEPLWHQKTENIFLDFIHSGFKAITVSVQGNLLGKEWVGRILDEEFLGDIKKLGNIDICGENGEYHTFVFNGPIFKKRIEIQKSEKILRDGFWFLDIQKYQLFRK